MSLIKLLTESSYDITKTLLVYVYDKNDTIKAFNLVPYSDEFNNALYDKSGKSKGYTWGAQIDDKKKYVKFDSIEQIQKWYDDRANRKLRKETENTKYPELSHIAKQLRLLKDIDYTIINRGSCFKFAKEVSKLGYKKYTFVFSEEDQEVIHVYIKLSENLYWDANGFHSKSDVKRKYDIGEYNTLYDGDIDELDRYCDIDTYSSLSTISISNEVWNKIIKIINSY